MIDSKDEYENSKEHVREEVLPTFREYLNDLKLQAGFPVICWRRLSPRPPASDPASASGGGMASSAARCHSEIVAPNVKLPRRLNCIPPSWKKPRLLSTRDSTVF